MQIHKEYAEDWKVTLVDTGIETQTGGRLKRIRNYLSEEDFCFTYGDGLSDINIEHLLASHKAAKKLATISVVQPPGRFGSVALSGDSVVEMVEKPMGDGAWINGGFFVLSPKVLDYINDDLTIWEREPLEGLVADEQLNAFKHSGFWQPMDTLREKNQLEASWESGNAKWKRW